MSDRRRHTARAHLGAGPVRSVLALVACLILTGCSGLAADPAVRPGLDIERDAPERDLQVAPPGPRDSAEPAEIVRGFIFALSGSGGDFAPARQFLSGEAAEEWSPDARTVVFRRSLQVTPVVPVEPDAGAGQRTEAPEPAAPDDVAADEPAADDAAADDAAAGEPAAQDPAQEATAEPTTAQPSPPVGEGDVVVRIGAAAWAEVSRDGHFRELANEEQVTSDIVLTQAQGQWRIRYLEPGFGRWLGTADFERLFDAYAVHYVYRAERLLIPDIRYVPGDRIATRLAQLQLGAPPGYLVGAVRNDIPASARLAVGSVPVVGGVATVDLSGEGIAIDPDSRSRLWALFVATLTQVRGVERVQLTLDGSPLEIPGIESVRSLSDLGFSGAPGPSRTTPLIRQGVVISEFSGRQRAAEAPLGPDPTPTQVPQFPPIEQEWQHLALSFSGGELAGVSDDSLSRWRNAIRYEVPGFANDLGRPCYDRYDALWVGGVGHTQSSDRLFVVNAAAAPTDPVRSPAGPVQAPWLAERRVLACHVSPQGTRIALISDAGAGTESRLDIGAIYRQANRLPTAVFGPQTIGEHFASVTDAVWLGETSMAVLAQTRLDAAIAAAEGDESGEHGTLPYLITVGGRTTALPSVLGGRQITSTGAERNLVVVGDGVYVRSGSQWLLAQNQGQQVMVGAR